MDIEHETLVYAAKYYGLIYLLLFSAAVLIYTFRPKNRKRFDDAAKSILKKEDKPDA